MSAPGRLAGLVALDGFPGPAASPEALRARLNEVLTRGTREVILEFVAAEYEPVPEWLVQHLCATDALAFAGGIEAEATEPRFWPLALSLDVPVLLVLGAEVELGEHALGLQLVQDLRYAELVTLDVAHLAVFHRTDLTLPLLERFLANVSPR